MKDHEQLVMAVCWATAKIEMEFFSAIWVWLKDTNWKLISVLEIDLLEYWKQLRKSQTSLKQTNKQKNPKLSAMGLKNNY